MFIEIILVNIKFIKRVLYLILVYVFNLIKLVYIMTITENSEFMASTDCT